MRMRLAGPICCLVAIGLLFTACASGTPGPPAVVTAEPDVPLMAKTVWSGAYTRDIQPIFDQYCINCHGPAKAENGLKLDNYANVIRGTQYGPVLVRGSSAASALVAVIQGTADPAIRMPHEGRKLTKNRIQNVVLWIDAGAPEN